MANVRLLRQSIDDYNARVAKLDANYQSQYGQYTKDVAAYNADVAAHPNDPQRSAQVGRQQYLMGYQGTESVYVPGGLGDDGVWVEQPKAVYADSPTTLANPVAPTQAVAPPEPNFTNNDIKAMANPGTDPAGVVRANNVGYTGNSNVAAMNSGAMRNSAFADPQDPNGLKERGILARVMGGQL